MNYLLKLISIVLPLKARIYLFFLYKHGYPVSFRTPKTWSEKIQCRKLILNSNDGIFADKFKVREYVEKTVGPDILIPLLGVYDELSLDDLKKLPSDVVLKTTHGSGVKHIHFLSDRCNFADVVEKFRSALNDSYRGWFFGETHYDTIERRVIAEQKLDFEGDSPPDFKFHVFNNEGEVTWVLQVDFDRFTDHKRNFYDSELNLLDLRVIYANGIFDMPAPAIVKDMAHVAVKLNGSRKYSRVDLYLHKDKIYFGEITLTPDSGFGKFSDRSHDIEMGKLWGEFN
ncbi:ATP-grasp fold amidoligase family protein [Vibrio diabolicus]|uniref:ATP-grasp fold amidoligase family protein n=1 Tax=Vibrio diabolicus TaxID=50719 RepID=UPI00211AB8AA|nr:hypothetical protein [Vibrio diabolicus]